MANLMKDYHDTLQREDLIGSKSKYKRDLKKVLCHIKMKIKEEHKDLLATKITKEEVREAIRKLPNGKAAGPDGIPQEV